MRFEEVHAIVDGTPFIYERNAKLLYNLIVDGGRKSVLEMGIAHGVATCYMAAAIDEIGGGVIHAVGLESARNHFSPSPEDPLERLGPSHLVELHRMRTGCNRFLHDQIVASTKNLVREEQNDLCIINGPKNWTIDGCAFFLADELLRHGGTLIFDGYSWIYADAAKRGNEVTGGVTSRSPSEDELNIPQVREVFELLVRQHPDYSKLEVSPMADWAIARKVTSRHKTYSVRYNEAHRDVLGCA